MVSARADESAGLGSNLGQDTRRDVHLAVPGNTGYGKQWEPICGTCPMFPGQWALNPSRMECHRDGGEPLVHAHQ